MTKEKKESNKINMPWYFSRWMITLMLLFGLFTFGVTAVIAVILWGGKFIYIKTNKIRLEALEVKNMIAEKATLEADKATLESEKVTLESNKATLEAELVGLNSEKTLLQNDIENSNSIFKAKKNDFVNQIKLEFEDEGKRIVENVLKENEDKMSELQRFTEQYDKLTIENGKLEKSIKSNNTKLLKLNTEYNGIKNLITHFPHAINLEKLSKKLVDLVNNYDEESIMKSLVELDYHAMNSKELRKKINNIKKEIANLLDRYKVRYTTKANKTIYQLMVIGLQAELQNILYTLTYTKHDVALDNAKALIQKYLVITSNGNALIAPTIAKFLTELEPLFLEAIEIEYLYYVKREQEKEEQRLIREQMKQEAADKKELDAQRKKIEAEEAKYTVELQRTSVLLDNETNPDVIAQLQHRIAELEQQQNQVAIEKEEILKRANGKAGYVYVISNLGSFGNQVFKVGMTRRMNPQDRVDELGDASVPFKFDVHAMVFSEDAVGLEYRLHQELAAKRLNKVNLRKEFFVTDVKVLKDLVETIDPTAEFKTTLVAQEYYRSLEIANERIIPTSTMTDTDVELEEVDHLTINA